MYKKRQTDEKADTHKSIKGGLWLIKKYPTLSVGNAGPPDTTYLYYSHVEGV